MEIDGALTQEKIDAALVGQELNSLVAKYVFRADVREVTWPMTTRVVAHYPGGRTEFWDLVISNTQYSTEHAAAREVEDQVENLGRWKEYIQALESMVNSHPPDGWERYRWNAIRATPEQRCRAALKIMVVQ